MRIRRTHLPALLLAPGVLALVFEPARWLAQTWTDPTWASDGGWVALACALLAARSALSGAAAPDPAAARLATRLLLATAAVRLLGRVLAVNLLGGAALVFDVWALGLLLRLRGRPWAVHPGALAALFAFALPLESALQRVLGFPLRWVSTVAAEQILAPFYADLSRVGTLLTGAGLELSVDLPCSGAQGLTLLGALTAALACRRRFGFAAPAWAALGALLANTLRIGALFVGLAGGAPLMREPWHSLVGLVCLAIGALPLLIWAGRRPPRTAAAPSAREPTRRPRAVPALVFSAAAVAVAAAPHRPIDVGRPAPAPALPASLGPLTGIPAPLDAEERAYFVRFGGQVEKRVYRRPGGAAPHAVTRVRTTAPLRHLHGPDRCLLGAGHRVERLGVVAGSVPTVVWRSTAPDGARWRVETSFLSDQGDVATTVSEVFWRWVRAPTAWTLLSRVTPWALCEADPRPCRARDAALFAAVEAPPAVSHPTATRQTATRQTATRQTATRQTATRQTATRQTATRQTATRQTATHHKEHSP